MYVPVWICQLVLHGWQTPMMRYSPGVDVINVYLLVMYIRMCVCILEMYVCTYVYMCASLKCMCVRMCICVHP